MNQNDIKNLSLEILKDTPIEDDLKKAFDLFEKVQNATASLNNIDTEQDLTLTKIGTVLSLNFFGVLLGGKKPSELTEEDWKEIAKEVTDKAILMDDQRYSVYIFGLYSDYIQHSADALKLRAVGPKRIEQIETIETLSKELRLKEEQLNRGEITEVAYTEDCLWISLDAMIKCIATYMGCFTGEDLSVLIQAMSSIAFEYGRLKLLRKEQALLDEYLRNQYELDDQMEVKFNAFKTELQEEADIFKGLIERAFEPDFRAALMGSVELARTAGVREDEILKINSDIDDFFLG